MEKKVYPEPLEALILIVITFIFVILIAIITMVLFLILSPQHSQMQSARVLYVLGGIPFIIVPFIYAKKKQYNLQSLFRLRFVSNETVLLSLIIGISLAVLGDELDRLIQIILPLPKWFLDQIESFRAETMGDWTLLLAGVVVFAALSEEFLFRGFLQVSLEKKGDVTRAVILSSLTWTIIHLNPFWAVQTFVMGVVIGFLAWRTDSIVPAIIVHATNNLISLLFLNFSLDTYLNWYLWKNHVSPLVILLALLLLILCIKKLTDMAKIRESVP